MKLYGIWCKDLNDNKGGWYRELPSTVNDGHVATLAFASKRDACYRAASEYGFDTYSEAKRNGWVEVKTLTR
jgi:hypothetical protein